MVVNGSVEFYRFVYLEYFFLLYLKFELVEGICFFVMFLLMVLVNILFLIVVWKDFEKSFWLLIIYFLIGFGIIDFFIGVIMELFFVFYYIMCFLRGGKNIFVFIFCFYEVG